MQLYDIRPRSLGNLQKTSAARPEPLAVCKRAAHAGDLLHTAHFQLGSFLIGLVSNWAEF